jgi:hypothetical protein
MMRGELQLAAVVVEEERGIGGEAAPGPAHGAAAEHGPGREADQDLLQDLFR